MSESAIAKSNNCDSLLNVRVSTCCVDFEARRDVAIGILIDGRCVETFPIPISDGNANVKRVTSNKLMIVDKSQPRFAKFPN